MNLNNNNVLITGANGGIGNSLIEKFVSLGAIVLASGTNEEKLHNLKKNFQILRSNHSNYKITTKSKILLK